MTDPTPHRTSLAEPTRTGQVYPGLRASRRAGTPWRKGLCAALLTLAAATAGANSPTPATQQRIIGYVRDADTQRYLYTEVHEQSLAADGAVQSAVTTYHDAQGREIARKTLDFRQHRTVPVYRMDIPALRYAEGISRNTPQVALFKRDADRESRKTLPLGEGLVAADAGFNQLLQDQLPAIRKGETVRFSLIVAGRTDRYSFRARKVDETAGPAGPTLRVRVEPDSLLRLLVDPIALSYDIDSRRLVSYQGVSNILDPGTQEVYRHIRITYDGPPPPDVKLPPPSQAFAQALR